MKGLISRRASAVVSILTDPDLSLNQLPSKLPPALASQLAHCRLTSAQINQLKVRKDAGVPIFSGIQFDFEPTAEILQSLAAQKSQLDHCVRYCLLSYVSMVVNPELMRNCELMMTFMLSVAAFRDGRFRDLMDFAFLDTLRSILETSDHTLAAYVFPAVCEFYISQDPVSQLACKMLPRILKLLLGMSDLSEMSLASQFCSLITVIGNRQTLDPRISSKILRLCTPFILCWDCVACEFLGGLRGVPEVEVVISRFHGLLRGSWKRIRREFRGRRPWNTS
jgi:hypothetical protein